MTPGILLSDTVVVDERREGGHLDPAGESRPAATSGGVQRLAGTLVKDHQRRRDLAGAGTRHREATDLDSVSVLPLPNRN